MDTVEEHVGKMDAELRISGVRLDKLLAKADAAGTEAKIDLPVRRTGGDRRTGGERRGTPPGGEPLGKRRDPFREVAPFLAGDEEPTRFMPDFQIEKTEDGFVFKADLLGIKANEVDIAVTGNRLTINGHIYDPRACSYAGFTRAFTLPEGSEGNKQIRAALDGGMLTVMLSKGLERAPEAPDAPTLPCDDPVERWESEGGGAR